MKKWFIINKIIIEREKQKKMKLPSYANGL